MSTIRMAAWVVGIITAICLYHTPISEASLALAILLGLCLIVVTWPAQKPGPVSPRFEDAQALSRLDHLDGVGNRQGDDDA